jgi:outer membrane translocation and assembly module TamA
MKVAVVFLFFCAVVFAADLTGVAFEGNRAFFSQTLENVLGLKSENGYKIWKKDENISLDDPSDLAEKLSEFYNSKGFYRATIESDLQDGRLLFKITENDPVKIDKFQLNSPFYIKQYLQLTSGDIFDTDIFVDMKAKIRRHLDENGYPKAKLLSSASIYLEPYKCDIELNITNAVKSKIIHIATPPLQDISRKAILDKLDFAEGDFFDIRKIESSRENLHLTDLFSSVVIEIDEENSVGDDIALIVKLEKGKEKSFKVSIGYTTDEGPRLRFSWINKNFNGDFKRLESSLKIMNKTQSADILLSVPKVLGMPFEDKVSFEKTIWEYQGYEEKRLSNAFRFSKDILATKHYFGLKSESGEVRAQNESEYVKTQIYTTNAITYEYILDKRNSKLDATSGHLIDMNIEFANNILASTLNYVKMEFEARKIYTFLPTSVLENFTIAGKGYIGTIDDLKKSYIPIFKRFFAGGSFSNRGYSYRKIGPQNADGDYIGAKSIVEMSIEGRYKFSKKSSAVLFYDSTMMNYSSVTFAGNLKPSVGAGLRYDTGVGPIRIDVGVPLNEQKRSPILHVSFGQLF